MEHGVIEAADVQVVIATRNLGRHAGMQVDEGQLQW